MIPEQGYTLKQRAVSGVVWSVLQNSGQAVLTLIFSLVLARLLMPRDFGLIGMLFVFVSVSSAFVESGFGAAIVRKQDADRADYSTVFTFNLVVSVLVYTILYLAAPAIARFYGQPMLSALMRVLGILLLLEAITLVPSTILYKTLAFRHLATVNVVSIIVPGILAVLAAMRDWGAWSLVLQQLSAALLKIPLYLYFCPWIPSLTFHWQRGRDLFSYGSKLLGASLIQKVFNDIAFLVIGRFYSAAALGHYSRAQQLQQVPTRSLSVGISLVTFPLFSALQDDLKRLKDSVRKAIMLEAFVVFPALAGIAIIAEPLVSVVLTDKWLPCVPYVRLFCLLGMPFPLQIVNQNVLRAAGRSDLFLYVEIVSKLLLVLALLLTVRYGISTILIGQIIHSWVLWAILASCSGRLLNYSACSQFCDMLPSIFLSLLMALSLQAASSLFRSDLLRLVLLPMIGVATYMLASMILRVRIWLYSIQILKEMLGYAK